MAEFSISPQFVYTTVDVSNNTVSVHSGPCIVRLAKVTVALSAHACPIYDGDGAATTLMATLAASAAIGVTEEFEDVFFQNGIFVDPDDSATGTFWISYAPVNYGVGSGAGLP